MLHYLTLLRPRCLASIANLEIPEADWKHYKRFSKTCNAVARASLLAVQMSTGSHMHALCRVDTLHAACMNGDAAMLLLPSLVMCHRGQVYAGQTAAKAVPQFSVYYDYSVNDPP